MNKKVKCKKILTSGYLISKKQNQLVCDFKMGIFFKKIVKNKERFT